MSGDAWGNDYFDDVYQRNGKSEQFTGYCTDVFFDEAFKFMEANRGRPFFVFLSTNAPHNPYVVPDEYSAPYRRMGLSVPLADFMGMVTNIDENVGRLRRKLKEWALEDNTILIFMTDNGALGGIRMENGDSDGFPLEPWNRFGANRRGTERVALRGRPPGPLFHPLAAEQAGRGKGCGGVDVPHGGTQFRAAVHSDVVHGGRRQVPRSLFRRGLADGKPGMTWTKSPR